MAKWNLRTFTSDTGAKPVDEWLRDLGRTDPEGQAEMFRVMELLEEHGTALEMPHSRPMGHGLLELRARSRAGIVRILYFHWKAHTFGLVHGFAKKQRQTSQADLRVARTRRDQWLARERNRR